MQAGPLHIDREIDWPTTLLVVLSDKNPNDTQTDDDGNIVADKAIEVQQVFINNFPIHQDLIDKIFACQHQDSLHITHENWWGFNGTATLDLDQDNPMRYMLSLQNKFDMNRLDWDQN